MAGIMDGDTFPWDHVVFTGSRATGKRVYEAAARQLCPVTLELQGKNPAIWAIGEWASIMQKEDFHLLQGKAMAGPIGSNSGGWAVLAGLKRLFWGKCLNAGQVCTSPDYLCLVRDQSSSLSNEAQVNLFVEWLKHLVEVFFRDGELDHGEYHEGAWVDQKQSTDLCRMIHVSVYDRLIDLLKNEPVEWLDGRSKPDRKTRFIPHGVVKITGNPEQSMSKLLTEEVFGPILPIMIFDSYEEAMSFTRSHPARKDPANFYGFTDDESLAERMVDESRSGNCLINDTLVHDSNHELPFGGVGQSGSGAMHGQDGFKQVSFPRAVMKHSLWFDTPDRYPPYLPETTSAIRSLLLGDAITGLFCKKRKRDRPAIREAMGEASWKDMTD